MGTSAHKLGQNAHLLQLKQPSTSGWPTMCLAIDSDRNPSGGAHKSQVYTLIDKDGHTKINNTHCVLCLATSLNHGATWTKPKLSQYRTPNGQSTNVVFVTSVAWCSGSVLYERATRSCGWATFQDGVLRHTAAQRFVNASCGMENAGPLHSLFIGWTEMAAAWCFSSRLNI